MTKKKEKEDYILTYFKPIELSTKVRRDPKDKKISVRSNKLNLIKFKIRELPNVWIKLYRAFFKNYRLEFKAIAPYLKTSIQNKEALRKYAAMKPDQFSWDFYHYYIDEAIKELAIKPRGGPYSKNIRKQLPKIRVVAQHWYVLLKYWSKKDYRPKCRKSTACTLSDCPHKECHRPIKDEEHWCNEGEYSFCKSLFPIGLKEFLDVSGIAEITPEEKVYEIIKQHFAFTKKDKEQLEKIQLRGNFDRHFIQDDPSQPLTLTLRELKKVYKAYNYFQGSSFFAYDPFSDFLFPFCLLSSKKVIF
jgi:hypothetical protein